MKSHSQLSVIGALNGGHDRAMNYGAIRLEKTGQRMNCKKSFVGRLGLLLLALMGE